MVAQLAYSVNLDEVSQSSISLCPSLVIFDVLFAANPRELEISPKFNLHYKVKR